MTDPPTGILAKRIRVRPIRRPHWPAWGSPCRRLVTAMAAASPAEKAREGSTEGKRTCQTTLPDPGPVSRLPPRYLQPVERSAALAAVFEPVTSPSTFEETVERLGTAIRIGLLPPGTRLPPERELAAELEISRSTLRQALTALVQSGLLLSLRGRGGGTFVAESPPLPGGSMEQVETRLRGVLDYRVVIETGAAVLAAERVEDEDLSRMEGLVDQMASTESFEEYRRADIRFHISIAEATRSSRLVSAMTEVQAELSEAIALIPHPEEVLTRSNAQHRRLVGTLSRRDSSRAVREIREHLEGTEHILFGLMPASVD